MEISQRQRTRRNHFSDEISESSLCQKEARATTTWTVTRTTQICIWTRKEIVSHALHVCFSFLRISQPFSSNQRREMTCFEIGRTTWEPDDKFSIVSLLLQTAPPVENRTHFAGQTTWSYVFRWLPCCSRPRQWVSSRAKDVTTEKKLSFRQVQYELALFRKDFNGPWSNKRNRQFLDKKANLMQNGRKAV